MVKFRGVSKNYMTPYLETAVKIACDLCVTQQCFKKHQITLHTKLSIICTCIINCPLKKIYIYTTLNLYIHPAETHRLLKFLYHRMGRLVPAHNNAILMLPHRHKQTNPHILAIVLF